MSQSSGSSCGGGGGLPDFDLSDEILAVIPADPYEQLDLARKITSMAIASRVSKLEAEMTRTKTKLYEKERIVFDLEEKLSRLQRASEEAESRLKLALDENFISKKMKEKQLSNQTLVERLSARVIQMKLAKERDMLAMTSKKLGRDLVKLETFKRQLMQSLNDENVAPVETIENGTCDQTIPKAYPENVATDGRSNGYSGQNSFSGSTDTGNTIDDASKNSGNRYTMTTYITPRLTPTGTPKNISSAVSPRGYSAFTSPKQISGATSPSKQPYDTRSSLSSWYPSSQQSSAANSPPHGRSLPGRTPRIDGKEFFRQARSRLSYEQFSAFLANIKELNAQKQTREDTLRNAEEIFGTDNKDLYLSFQGLLNRSIR